MMSIYADTNFITRLYLERPETAQGFDKKATKLARLEGLKTLR